MNLEEFNGKHTGQTAFVLGAGTSLHFQNLELLKDRLVFAVNSAYVGAPWATYFVSDDWSVAHWSYFFQDLQQSETTIPLLYEDKLASSAHLFGDRAVLFRHRKGISIPKKYVHENTKYHIGETRTSVGTAIMIAHIMGCSRIALLGVDGCRKFGNRYFWQLNQHLSPFRETPYKIPFRNDGMPIDRYKRCKIKGQITDCDLIDIAPTWKKLGSAINEECEVYNTSNESIISIFPKKGLESIVYGS